MSKCGVLRPLALARRSEQWIPRASVWRGRDDPTGELAPRIEDVVHLLSGPIDNQEPRVVPRRAVDKMVRRHFAELQIGALWDKIGLIKCTPYHYSINKYKAHYRRVVYPPVYGMAFKDATLPLMVDIGTGNGWVTLLVAKRNPHMNVLGLEKRSKRVEIAQRFAKELGLTNVHFVLCNATLSFETLMATYPGPISLITILCPDPHIKKRYKAIRMVRSSLVEQILGCLAPGGKILFQSEFEDVAEYIREYFDAHLGEYLSVVDEDNTNVYDENGWLLMNPLGVRSEVEIDAVAHGEQVYRRYYERLEKPYAPRIPYWTTLPPSKIETPLPLEPKKEQSIYLKKYKPYGRRKCRMVRRLSVPASDIILNGECYPKSFFKKMLEGPLLKYRYRSVKLLKAKMRPLDPSWKALGPKPRKKRTKKPLGVYHGWKQLYKM